MKKLFAACTAVLAWASLSTAQPNNLEPTVFIPSFALGEWVQAERAEETDFISVAGDLRFERIYTRQFGRDGSEIPYPTTCRVKQIGVVLRFDEASPATKDRFEDIGKRAPTYTIQFLIRRTVLMDSTSNTEHCAEFVRMENQAAGSHDGILSTWHFVDLADDVIVDSWRDTVLIKRK